jgi:predicted pyridoxine 5'-phosphate oxidase superfamily flavin-nucleotide-binding protein
MPKLPTIDPDTAAGPAASLTQYGFHEGELAVQQRAGARHLADRLSSMLDAPELAGGAAAFLAARTLAVLSARDRDGQLWVAPLTGAPGFLAAGHSTLRVHAAPATGDPLADLPADQAVGLLAIDFATRRRMRINGTLTATGPDGLTVRVDQAYGNCPQYIQRRDLSLLDRPGSDAPAAQQAFDEPVLDAQAISLVQAADTFFLGTTHPMRGTDASHRGGTPGFVRLEPGGLWWPDYPGNNMFNSLGNLEVDDTAALLFIDFATAATVHLSGRAHVEWTIPAASGDDGGTGRRVHFTPAAIRRGAPFPLHSSAAELYRRNPPLTD